MKQHMALIVVLVSILLFGEAQQTIPIPPFSVVSIAQACDEFHGDFNCTCAQSIFNPCCPWWEPSRCPPALRQRAKDAAQAGSNYLSEASGGLGAFELATCGTTIVAAATANLAAAAAFGVPCLGGMSGRYAADRFKAIFDRAVTDPPDYNYWSDYEGGSWPTLADIGVDGYTGWWWVDNLIGDVQGAEFYSDFAYVSNNRLTTCQGDLGNDAAPCVRQRQLADWGFYMVGWYSRDVAANLRVIKGDLEQMGADGNLTALLGDVANVTDWVGWELQQQ